jgi:putative oxidoreductase
MGAMMFEQSTSGQARDKITDWVLRAGVALAFVLFGLEKFPSGPDSQWVRFFDQVGIGQWFRDFTGIIEVASGALVLLPATTRIGVAILAVTMAVASMIHIFVIHQPANAIITGALCLALIGFWRRMRTTN